MVAKCINNLEQDMELLAITGVEGKFLQFARYLMCF